VEEAKTLTICQNKKTKKEKGERMEGERGFHDRQTGKKKNERGEKRQKKNTNRKIS
jgi:hypothetical protein